MTSNYFEPNAAPEAVVKKKTEKRKILMRFKTQQDVFDFVKKTGIQLTHKRNVSIIYPLPRDVFSLMDD